MPLSPRVRRLVDDLRSEWRELDRRIEAYDDEFAAQARSDETARRLTTIPGIGVVNATALVAAIGNAQAFQRGRDLAAWLGLVPRQMTTGGKARLLGISKRGNEYLRRMLIHGARASLSMYSKLEMPLGEWLRGLLGASAHQYRRGGARSEAGRIAWAVLRCGERFEMQAAAAT